MRSYSATFGSYRIPEAFVLYAGSLQSLEDSEEKKKVLGAFSVLMQEGLSGSFTAKRYDTSLSRHLDRMIQVRPGILDLWKENSISGPVSEFINGNTRESLLGCTIHETDIL
jgi:hypothetical protein